LRFSSAFYWGKPINQKGGEMTSNQRMKMLIWFMALFLFGGVSVVMGAIPTTINYQGQLTDDQGDPVPDGSYDMQFYLFDAATGGNQLWNSPNGEQQTVTHSPPHR
jgi:hypothetical protein